MAASLRNFTLSDSEHCELSDFTATIVDSLESFTHCAKLTMPNSPEPIW